MTAHFPKYFVTPSGTFDYSFSAVSHGGPVPACCSRSTLLAQFFFVEPCDFQERWGRELFCHLRPQSIDGKVPKVDGSHKYVKLVRVFDSGAAGGTKPVHCMVTFFNEFEQVRCELLIRAEIQFQYKVYLSGPFCFVSM